MPEVVLDMVIPVYNGRHAESWSGRCTPAGRTVAELVRNLEISDQTMERKRPAGRWPTGREM